MSGASPRETNIAVGNGRGGDGGPNQTEAVGDAVAPAAAAQASRQQLSMCWPFGQHDF